uniref:C-type lectin domain-containing protein n=1 Tax=Xiphophorus maculatus TaxID=8083 RepID=A0A3B5Q6F0_XIPMA
MRLIGLYKFSLSVSVCVHVLSVSVLPCDGLATWRWALAPPPNADKAEEVDLDCWFQTSHFTFKNVMYFPAGWFSLSTCRQYHFVNQSSTWSEALTHCRQTYTDLASISSVDENNELKKTLNSAGHSSDVRIGLYNEVDWKWSDGFSSSGADYRNWYTSAYDPDFIGANQSVAWKFLSCEKKLPFVCYNFNKMSC